MHWLFALAILFAGSVGLEIDVPDTNAADEYENGQIQYFEERVVPSKETVDADPEKSFAQFFEFEIPDGVVIKNYEYVIYENEPNFYAVVSCDAEASEEMINLLNDYYFPLYEDEYEYSASYLSDLSEQMEWWELSALSDDVVIYEKTERHYTADCKCLAERYMYVTTASDGTKTIYAMRIYPHMYV